MSKVIFSFGSATKKEKKSFCAYVYMAISNRRYVTRQRNRKVKALIGAMDSIADTLLPKKSRDVFLFFREPRPTRDRRPPLSISKLWICRKDVCGEHSGPLQRLRRVCSIFKHSVEENTPVFRRGARAHRPHLSHSACSFYQET